MTNQEILQNLYQLVEFMESDIVHIQTDCDYVDKNINEDILCAVKCAVGLLEKSDDVIPPKVKAIQKLINNERQEIKLNKYYHLKMNKYCSFEIKVVDIAKNGDFLGLTHFGHRYKFKNEDAIKCIPSRKEDSLQG